MWKLSNPTPHVPRILTWEPGPSLKESQSKKESWNIWFQGSFFCFYSVLVCFFFGPCPAGPLPWALTLSLETLDFIGFLRSWFFMEGRLGAGRRWRWSGAGGSDARLPGLVNLGRGSWVKGGSLEKNDVSGLEGYGVGFRMEMHIVFQINCNYPEILQISGEIFWICESWRKPLRINAFSSFKHWEGWKNSV